MPFLGWLLDFFDYQKKFFAPTHNSRLVKNQKKCIAIYTPLPLKDGFHLKSFAGRRTTQNWETSWLRWPKMDTSIHTYMWCQNDKSPNKKVAETSTISSNNRLVILIWAGMPEKWMGQSLSGAVSQRWSIPENIQLYISQGSLKEKLDSPSPSPTPGWCCFTNLIKPLNNALNVA